MHGYGIAQYIQAVSDDILRVDEGSLYPALQRLLLNGWVDAEWGHSANNRRARFYRLTPAGRKQLERELSSFERLIGACNPALSAMLTTAPESHGASSLRPPSRSCSIDAFISAGSVSIAVKVPFT